MADPKDPFQQRYEETMAKYHAYFEQVRAAFKQHCQDIKEDTLGKLKTTSDDDKEARKKILMDQKRQLDETLAELKQLLNFQSAKMRKALEEIRRQQDEQQFNLDEELASLE